MSCCSPGWWWSRCFDRSVRGADSLKRPVDITDYLTLASFISSLATGGGAIGSGLEDEGTVRAAAYGYHPEPPAGDEKNR
jgi:hypothetical protein